MTDNIFQPLPDHLPAELTEALVEHPHVRIERIVSTGQASPDGFWYEQAEHEWVIVLRGQAKLQIEGDELPRNMQAGDFVNIPAGLRHRVEWTTPEEPTVWLAVFYGAVVR